MSKRYCLEYVYHTHILKILTNTHQYVNFIGSGVTILEIIDALRESRDYILNQFQKKMSSEYYVAGNKNLKWTDSNVYRWIYAGLPMVRPCFTLC
jgi:hypothetical protein